MRSGGEELKGKRESVLLCAGGKNTALEVRAGEQAD